MTDELLDIYNGKNKSIELIKKVCYIIMLFREYLVGFIILIVFDRYGRINK
jgi:hypothetical protein